MNPSRAKHGGPDSRAPTRAGSTGIGSRSAWLEAARARLNEIASSRRVFDLGASTYDQMTKQIHWRDQVRRVIPYFASSGRLGAGLRVLDLGCGPGVSTYALAEALPVDTKLFGVDLAPGMIARTRLHPLAADARYANVRFLLADATALPFADGAFDVVVGHSLLYLVPDRPRVLAEARRVAAPGGTLALLEPSAAGSLRAAALSSLARVGELVRRPLPTARFVASMVAWRAFSSVKGRLSAPQAEALLREAGFEECACFSTLAGLGMHCVGHVRATHR